MRKTIVPIWEKCRLANTFRNRLLFPFTVLTMFHVVYSTYPFLQQISICRLQNHLNKSIENLYKWKFSYYIELKQLCQMAILLVFEQFLILSHYFQCLLQRCQKRSKCGQRVNGEQRRFLIRHRSTKFHSELWLPRHQKRGNKTKT